jgi:MFS transporter, SP family, solute carrier family 2 (facilitated glucose transporter), member 3
LARLQLWRYVLVASTLLAILQIATAIFISDTPAWLAAQGRHTDALIVSRKLWGIEESPGRSRTPSRHRRSDSDDAARSLLSDGGRDHDDTDSPTLPTPSTVPPSEPIGILQMLKRRELRRAVYVVVLAMLVQQGSGINAGVSVCSLVKSSLLTDDMPPTVIYYSTDILSQVVPTSAAYISLLISVTNVIMTFVPVLLIEVRLDAMLCAHPPAPNSTILATGPWSKKAFAPKYRRRPRINSSIRIWS